MTLGTIYQAINKINSKSYIGKTFSNFKKYKQDHIKNALNGHKKYFYSAIRKYSKENFKWKILFQGKCHPNKLHDLEIFFIAYYDTFGKNGYNLTEGGDGGALYTKERIPKYIRIKNGQKVSKALNKINPKTGLTGYQENIKKIAETMKQINPKTGLTGFQEAALKASETMKKINPETGLSIYQKSIKKSAETMKKINPETGLSIYQENRVKISKTMKERGTSIGLKHPMAKKYLLIAPNVQKIGAWGNLKKICKRYNLNFSRIYGSINKGRIKVGRKCSKKAINCIDWEIIKI